MSKEKIYIKMTDEFGNICKVGSWDLPNEKLDNFKNQQDLGWHIMLEVLQRKYKKLEIVIGDDYGICRN